VIGVRRHDWTLTPRCAVLPDAQQIKMAGAHCCEAGHVRSAHQRQRRGGILQRTRLLAHMRIGLLVAV
jgi:hypothetical protein